MPQNRQAAGTRTMFAVAVLLAVLATAMCCPSGCTCKWKGGKQTVECVNKSLSAAPAGMDAGTQVLDMSGNPLDELTRSWFMTAGLSNLQKIFMARCRIGRIDNAAFQGLSNLVELDLSDNGIVDIPTKSFDDYPQLMKLVMSGNAMTTVRTAAFKRLAYLTVLDLSRCQLTVVEPGAFDGLRSLEWLRLDHNRIVRIEGVGAGGGAVLPLSLHGIEMHHNPWMCDCRMRDVHRWLNNNSAPHTLEPTCHGPDRLRGASVRKLAPDELACAPEAQAASPVDVETDAGKNLTLACRVTPTGEARVSWWFEGRLMAANGSTVAAADGSVLSIEDVSPTNNGTYSCVAENRAGRATCNFTVRVVQEPSEMAAGSYPPDAPPPALLAVVLAAGSVCFVVIAVAFAVCCRLLVTKRRRRRAANGGRASKSNGTAGAADGDDPTANGQPAKSSSDIRQSDSVNLTVSSTVDGKLSSAEDLSTYAEYDPVAAAAAATATMATGAGVADAYEVHEVLHMGGGYDAYLTHSATAGHSTMTTTLEANPDLISDASTVVRDNVGGDRHHDSGGEVYKITVPPGPGGHEFWPGSAAVVYSSGGGSDSYELQLSPGKLAVGEPYPPDYGLPKLQPAAMGYPPDYGLPKMGSYPVPPPPPPSVYRTLPHRRNAAKPQGRAYQESEFVLLQQHQHHHHHHHHHQQQHQQQLQQQHLHPDHQHHQNHHHPHPMRYTPQNVRYNQQGYPYPAEGTFYSTAEGAAAFYEPPSLTNASAQTLDDETMMMMMVMPPPPPPHPSAVPDTTSTGRHQQRTSAEQQQKHKAVTSVQKQTANTESPDEGYVGEGPDS